MSSYFNLKFLIIFNRFAFFYIKYYDRINYYLEVAMTFGY